MGVFGWGGQWGWCWDRGVPLAGSIRGCRGVFGDARRHRGWHTSWQRWCRPAGVGVVCAPRGWEQGSGILHPRLWFDRRVERGQTGPVLVCWAPCLHSVSCFLTLRPGSTAWPGWLHPLTHPPTIPLSIPLSIPGSSRCRRPCLTGSSSSRCWPHPTAGSGRGFAGQRWPRLSFGSTSSGRLRVGSSRDRAKGQSGTRWRSSPTWKGNKMRKLVTTSLQLENEEKPKSFDSAWKLF